MAYFYCWLIFVVMRSLYTGHRNYEEYRLAGYNKVLFEQTGQRVEFKGGFGERISCTLVSALRQMFSVDFLVSTTFYFLPIAIGLFFFANVRSH